jgi:hypothetical protein
MESPSAFEVKDIPSLGITNGVFGLDVLWQKGNVKQTFYLDAPGELARIRWQCRVKDSALSWTDNTNPDDPIYHKGLNYSVADYAGEVTHGSQPDSEAGWTQHWWTFEPDGKQIDAADVRTPKERFEQGIGLVVDPYLSVDESGADIDVYCDGFSMRFVDSNTNIRPVNISSPTAPGTYWIRLNQRVNDGTDHYFAYDDNRVDTIVENTPNRVVIRQEGNFDATSGASSSYLTNSVGVTYTWYIYPDRLFCDIVWEVSGAIDLGSSWIFYWDDIEVLTHTNTINESSGSEQTGNSGTYNSADYIGFLASEMDVMCVLLEVTGEHALNQNLIASECSIQYAHDAATDITVAGFNNIRVVTILDSASREGSAKIYNSTDRLAMGDQYKDLILNQSPSKGDDVTDMVLPARLGSGTLHSDGAHHYEVDSNDELEIGLDIVRLRPMIAIPNWPFKSGTVASPIDHLIEHLKLDDNAASSTVVATVGNNANWEDSEGTNRNTDNDDVSSDIFRGTGLDTKDTYHVDLATTVYDNAFFKQGTVILHFNPQFGYDDAADQTLWYLYVDADDYIEVVYDAGNDRYELRVSWGGTLTTLNGTAYIENYPLQRPTIIHAGWDSEKDFCFLKVDDVDIVFGVNTGTPSASGASYSHIGAASDGDGTTSLNADVYLDDYKALDNCILKWGAFHIGNGQGFLVDIDTPYKHLSWYFDGQAELAQGSTDLGTAKNPTNSGGSFVTTDPLFGTNHWDSNGATNVITRADSAEDIVDYNKGFVAGWFNVQSFSGGEYVFDVRDADGSDRISAVLDASGNIDVTYRSNSVDEVITGDIAITAGKWFWLKVTWDDTDKVHAYINGMENGTPQDIANTWGGGSGLTWYFTEDYNGANGVDAFIQTLWFGKDPGCPEIPTAFGQSLHVPLTGKA